MFVGVEFKIGIPPFLFSQLSVAEGDEGRVNVASRFGRESDQLNR